MKATNPPQTHSSTATQADGRQVATGHIVAVTVKREGWEPAPIPQGLREAVESYEGSTVEQPWRRRGRRCCGPRDGYQECEQHEHDAGDSERAPYPILCQLGMPQTPRLLPHEATPSLSVTLPEL